MDIYDFVLLPVYLGIIYLIANLIRARNLGNRLYNQYFIKGLNYKMIGALGYASIYLFYYKDGDTISFFKAIRHTFGLFLNDPSQFFSFIFSPSAPYPDVLFWPVIFDEVYYITVGSASLTTIKICSFINLFCCNSFIPLTLVIAFLSYLFVWKAFMLFVELYPYLEKKLVIAFLMIPSVIFWGSCIGKDSIMLSAIMFFFVCYHQLFIKKRNFISNMIYLVMSAYILSSIRGFMLFTIVPSALLMTAIYYRNSLKDRFMRFVALPVFLVVAIGGSFFLIKSIGSAVSTYSMESLEKKAQGFRSWHTTQGGSSYSLGDDDFSMTGMLKKSPMAIAIALFGPFFWQIRNPVMLMSGVESLIFLFFFVKTFFNARIYRAYNILFRDYIIMFCIPFILIMALAVGLTSFNYGALVRYKIPLLPFLALLIIVVEHRLKTKKAVTKRLKKTFRAETPEAIPAYT